MACMAALLASSFLALQNAAHGPKRERQRDPDASLARAEGRVLQRMANRGKTGRCCRSSAAALHHSAFSRFIRTLSNWAIHEGNERVFTALESKKLVKNE